MESWKNIANPIPEALPRNISNRLSNQALSHNDSISILAKVDDWPFGDSCVGVVTGVNPDGTTEAFCDGVAVRGQSRDSFGKDLPDNRRWNNFNPMAAT